MKKQVLLYSAIYSYTAASFIKDLADNKNSNIEIRVNTPGGSVLDGYGMIAQIAEHEKDIFLKIDGQAASMGAILCLFVPTQNIEALDVSTFLFHRAAYGWWIEDDKKAFTPELQASLKKVNDHLRAAMEGKFTAEQWFKETGVSLDDLFSIDSRIDVEINAEQAKRLGIVGRINVITPEKRAEINSLSERIAAIKLPEATNIPVAPIDNNNSNQNNNTMTFDELKSKYPDAYKAAFAEGQSQERDRVCAYMAFAHVDLETVKKSIADGKNITQTEMAEFSVKMLATSQLNALQAGNAPGVTNQPQEQPKPADEVAAAAFKKGVLEILGISK